MNDIFGKVFAILLSVWLMFLYPLQEAQKESIKLEKMYLYQETVRFVDNIRNTGIIAQDDFSVYLKKMSGMNSFYEVEMIAGMNNVMTLFEAAEGNLKYQLDYNDFVKVLITDKDKNVAVCYGGSVKAENQEKEGET